MILQHFFAMSAGIGVENVFFIAIAVLACVLGAEIAGICILVSKMRHARSQEEDATPDDAAPNDHSQNYAAAVFLFGAVSATAQVALLVLAICTAVAALILTILLIVFRAKGYYLIASKKPEEAKEDEPEEAAVAEEAVEEAEVPAEEETFAYSNLAATEPVLSESVEEETTEDGDQAVEAVFAEAEEGTKAEAEAEECVAPAEESVPESKPVVLVQPVGQANAVPGGIPVYSSAYPGGQPPYVEKHVTETYKEVIKETNTTTTTNNVSEKASDRTNEEVLKAIAELMKLGTQLRMEREMAVEHPAAQKANEDSPAFVDAEEDAEVDEPEEEDDVDVEDSAEEKETDVDDEYESDLFSGNERIVGFDEETGCYIVAHYRKSFEAKLIQSRPDVKKYYSRIKNALFGYEGTKDRITWTINTFSNEHAQIAKINVRTRTLDLYLALDPATLEDTVYHGKDVGDKKKYAETPFLYKVNSARKLTLALELVQRACEEQGLSPIDIEEVNYEEQYPFEATESLISRGLIREYLREEKPAVTFELDPDHVPQVPEEDESVIPVNANFVWEFDNEQMPEPEPEPEPEIVIEPEVVEAPATEVVSGTTTTTTTHETIKTTERHYTERYYGIPTQTMQQAIPETAHPIEVLAEPIEVEADPAEEQQSVEAADGVIAQEPVETVENIEETYEESGEIVEETPDATEEEVAEVYEDEETEEVYEDEETEEVYEDEETEAVYEDEETEEVYEDEETEEVYEDEEAEEVYEDEETEEVYEDEETEEAYEDEETEGVYEDEETEEVYEDEEEVEEEEPAHATVAPQPIPNSNPDVALLDVCLFDEYFENGAIVNLETLKQVGLAPETATRLKVYASGALKGQFTVEANHFTLDAIKAIGDADGDSIMIR